MNAKLAITTANIDGLHVPAKVRPFLDKALDRGLTVEQDTDVVRTDGRSNYIVSSPNPIDDWNLWLYHASGRNGGRLKLVRYAPVHSGTRRRSATTDLTRRDAFMVLDDMGDALDRHHARQAVNTARDAHAADLDAAVATRPAMDIVNTATGETVGTVTPIVPDAHAADPEQFAQAIALAASLKANGKFAIRAAHRGTIPRNTPAKVRNALVRRGLAGVAGGVLTDLGRTVRSLIIA